LIVLVKNIGVFIHKNRCGMWDINQLYSHAVIDSRLVVSQVNKGNVTAQGYQGHLGDLGFF
jgi:hypothetical protein